MVSPGFYVPELHFFVAKIGITDEMRNANEKKNQSKHKTAVFSIVNIYHQAVLRGTFISTKTEGFLKVTVTLLSHGDFTEFTEGQQFN